jgi:hypothetical protein
MLTLFETLSTMMSTRPGSRPELARLKPLVTPSELALAAARRVGLIP